MFYIKYSDTLYGSGDVTFSANTVTKITYLFEHDYDIIIPCGIYYGSSASKMLCTVNNYTEGTYTSVVGTVYNYNDEDITADLYLYAIGIKKGE